MNLHRFDLVSLRLYIMVVDAGSLTAGARSLNMSLAAASKRIVDLEQHCGMRLLIRSKQGVRPTPVGQSLYHHALEVIGKLEQLASAIEDFQAGITGQLRLWANTSALAGFLPPLLATYAAANPGVSVELEDALSEESVRALLGGMAELAIIGENTLQEGLDTVVCDIDELVLVVPEDHALGGGGGTAPAAVPFETVLQHDLITLARPTSLTRRIAAEAEAMNRPLKIRIQVRSFDAMCHMVSSGIGLAILPRAAALPQLASRRLAIKSLEGMNTRRRMLLAMRHGTALSSPSQVFFDIVMHHHHGSVMKTSITLPPPPSRH